jgi:hypothetical protein
VDYSTQHDVVRQAQARINALGFTPALVVDGAWGPKTSAGVGWARQNFKLGLGGLDDAAVKALGISGAVAPVGPQGPNEFAALVSFAQKQGQTVTQASGIAPGFQATRASVIDSFVSWSTPLEGYTDYLYTDAEGLVTTGMGNLVDSMAAGQTMHVNCGHGTSKPCGQAAPTAMARSLPWSGDIAADWVKIKTAWPGVQSTACKGITSARLSADAVRALVSSKLRAMEPFLMQLPGFAQAPADAQLAVYSMAWAMGPGFAKTWIAFRTAFGVGDYASAAAQSHMQGVGIDIRNLANKLLLTNAALVKSLGLDPDHLYYIDGLKLLQSASTVGALGLHAPGAMLAALGLHGEWVADVGIVMVGAICGVLVAGATGGVFGMLIGGIVDIARRVAKR